MSPSTAKKLYNFLRFQPLAHSPISDNPLINDFRLYVLSKAHTFQNMASFQVDEDMVIADYVRHRAMLHDGLLCPKELFAFLETLVAFSPLWLQG